MKQKIVVIVGPTASGKTALSVSLAKKVGGEVISADSMQIYREMNIGTAKPSFEERDGVPHHLMGHISVEEDYSVVSYVDQATVALSDLKARNSLPILCGGTGLYIDHLLNGTYFEDIPGAEEARVKFQKIATEEGNQFLYDLLKKRDPLLASKLHPNDLKRVIRGLEVYEAVGKPLSVLQEESRRESPYETLWLGVNYSDRSLLYQRIDQRVDRMMEQGLLDEIRLLTGQYTLSATARAAIGYKEIIDAMESGDSIDDAVALVKQKSRNYAKRQLTWFGRNPKIHWFNRDELSEEEILASSEELVDRFLKG